MPQCELGVLPQKSVASSASSEAQQASSTASSVRRVVVRRGPYCPLRGQYASCVLSVKSKYKATNDSEQTTLFIHDTGSDTHITNTKSRFIEGTERGCKVDVYGIGGDSNSDGIEKALRANVCGSVEYRGVVLRNVLFVEGAQLCSGVPEAAVLVCGQLLAEVFGRTCG